MREILFRGKRIDTGEWVEGYYVRLNDVSVIITKHYVEYFDRISGKTSNSGQYVVVPSTVGQCVSGLIDKNGKKIFEGDIINYNGTYHKVIWEDRNCNARFGIVMDELETWDFSASVPANLMEVIGNIHDNPELLEEQT